MTEGDLAARVLPLLFNLMGPIGLIPAFAAMTAGMDRPTQHAVALRATVLSLVALAIAVFVGAGVLDAWGVASSSLVLAAGLILTLSVLKSMLMGGGHGGGGTAAPRPPRDLAASPLAFPTIVSPQAVSVLVIFVAYVPEMPAKLTIFGLVLLMMAINFGAMRIAHWFMARVGMVPLMVLGAVFGVLQAALGIEMILDGVRAFVGSMPVTP